MAKTRLVSMLKTLRAAVDEFDHGRPAQRRRHLSALVEFIVTAEPPEALLELGEAEGMSALRRTMKRLHDFLSNHSPLPEALCCRYRYRQATGLVLTEWGIRKTEWREAHQLANDAGIAFDLLYDRIDVTRLPWHDPIEEELASVDVILDPAALDDLLLCAIEGLLSPKKGKRKGYEVYGVALGMVKTRTQARRRGGVSTRKAVYILRCQPQLSADSTYRSVEWRERSIDALIEASHSLFPQYAVIADFHSHPYDTLEELYARRGWDPSEGDAEDGLEWFREVRRHGDRPEVSLIVAIAPSRARTERGHCQIGRAHV
jgi:hypothetical protein